MDKENILKTVFPERYIDEQEIEQEDADNRMSEWFKKTKPATRKPNVWARPKKTFFERIKTLFGL